ncbi:hypothetical protein V8C26DRAFT_411250 [Trichoderma gracile]
MRSLAGLQARVFVLSQRTGASGPIGQPLHNRVRGKLPREIAESTADHAAPYRGRETRDESYHGRVFSKSTSPSASSPFPRRDLDTIPREQLLVCPIGHVVSSLCIPPMDLVSDPSTIVQGTTSTPPHPRPLTTPKGNRGPPPPLVVL